MSKASLFSKLAAGNGNLIPDSDEGRDLGSASKKWKDLYLSGSSLILGSVTLKDSGGQPSFTNLNGDKVKIDLSAMSTGDLSEGSNLYYTLARDDSAFDVRLSTKSTTDISEGSNLYYTDIRVEAVVNPMIDSAINALVNGAPGQLNTLDELSAALNDDSNFANTVTANIATKLAIRHDITVTVASGTNEYGTGNKYYFEGSVSPYLHLQPGRTYRFDQSDASNSGHPLRFSTNANNSPSATYSTGVTVVGTPGSAGAYTEIAVTAGTPPLHYYCTNHSGMGGSSPAGSIFDGQWSSLTGTPTTISGYGITDAFDGAFSSLSGTPTTISGYGITDAFDGQYSSLTGAPTTYAWSTITSTPTTISGYGITDAQATLVSGTNIKTINGNTLLGSGNLVISGGGSGGTDSATVSAIILADVDSAYVQARQSATGGGTVDSADIISIVDSAYVQARQAAGSGPSLTIQEEGVSLATLTSTLNFVGDGVTASGTGATKTITISGGGGSGTVDSAQTISLITSTIDSAYVQARQSAGASSVPAFSVDGGVDTFKFTSDSGQSIFTGSDSAGNTLSFDPINVNVFLNGIFLQKGLDYTTTGNNTIIFTPALDINQDVIIQNIDVKSSSALVSGGINTYAYTADSGQTAFSGADDNGNSLQFTGNNISAYLNGVLLQRSTDYNLSNENTLTLTFDATTGDEISIVSFDPTSTDNLASYFDSSYITSRVSVSYPARGSVENFFYTATDGQLTFSGNDANGNLLQFTQDNKNVLVSVNGVLLIQETDYTTNASTNTLTLVDSASAGDQIYINTFSNLYRSTGLDSIDMQEIIDSNFITSRISDIFVSTDIVDSNYITSRISGIYPITNAVTRFKFTSDSNQSIFTGADSAGNILSFDSQNVNVFLNGIFLEKGADYTTSGGNTITMTPALPIDQDVIIQNFTIRSQAVVGSDTILEVLNNGVLQSQVDSAYISQRIGEIYGGARSFDTYRYVSTEGQAIYTGNDINGNALSFTDAGVQVHLNGILLTQTQDYTTSAGNSITLLDSIGAGNEIIINSFETKFTVDLATSLVDSSYVIARIPNHSATTNINKFKFTTTGPQTVFTGTDDAGNTLSFDSDNILVFMNGVNLYQGGDFTTSGGNTITLNEPTDSNFEIVVNNFDKYFNTVLSTIDSAYVISRMPQYGATNQVDKYRFVAATNQTLFGGVDADGNTLSYTPGKPLQVFLNGILLSPSVDYTASNGTTVTLTDPADAGFELIVYDYNKNYNINVIDATFVDSAYVQARQSFDAIDSAYVQLRQTDLLNVPHDILPDLDSTRSLGSPTRKWKELYLSGNTLHLGNAQISAQPSGGITLPAGSQIGNDPVPTTIEQLTNITLDIPPETLSMAVDADAAGGGAGMDWKWSWKSGPLAYTRSTISNQTQSDVPLYKKGTYTLFNFAAHELTGELTQTHKIYLKWIDGPGQDNLVSWANSTLNVQGITFDGVRGGDSAEVQRLNINVPEIITPPTLTPPNVSYDVSYITQGSYTFGGAAFGNNPDLVPLYRGGTYTFNLDSTSLSGHPFYLTTDSGANYTVNGYIGEYTTGVTGSRNTSGTLVFTVDSSAPDTLYYQCGNHASMKGQITIKDLEVETNEAGNYVLYFQHDQQGHSTSSEIRPVPTIVNQVCLVYNSTSNQFEPQDMGTYLETTPQFQEKVNDLSDIKINQKVADDTITNLTKVKDQTVFVANLNQQGELQTVTGTARWYAPYNLKMVSIVARVRSSADANISLDIKKNGTSIKTSTIIAGQFSDTVSSPEFTMADGDYLTLDVNTVGNTNKGEDLVVQFKYKQV